MKLKKLRFKLLGIILLIIFLILAGVSGYLVFNISQKKTATVSPKDTKPKQALGQTIRSASPIITPSPTSPQKTLPLPVLKKSTYVIAAYGDSMIDTMGEHLEHLQAVLKQKYPNTSIKYYNFGVGSQNAEDGLARLDKPLIYKERDYPLLREVKPDIIILGSFSYNPFSPHNLDQHKQTLTKLIQEVKMISPNVYLLAEIAPLADDFGKGEKGVNWEQSSARQHAENIIEQLENTISLARQMNIPIVNAYIATKSQGKFGSQLYVNPDDGIHPSDYGHKFMADLIAKTIKLD